MISIHCNSFTDSNPNGFEIYCHPNHNKIAMCFDQQMRKMTSFARRGIKDGRHLYIIKHSVKPVILLELGFMSNRSDLRNLLDPKIQLQYSKLIFDGLLTVKGKYENRLMQDRDALLCKIRMDKSKNAKNRAHRQFYNSLLGEQSSLLCTY